MARALRMALDLSLVSLRTVGPVVSKMWMSAKNMIGKTKARPLVMNPVVNTAESALDKMSNMLLGALTSLRDRQLPKEQAYLERELEKVKSKMSKGDDGGGGYSSSSKTLKPALGIAWQYAKTEMIPPLTHNFFHGPIGRKLEDTISKAADGFIANIQNRIKDIEEEARREIKHKEILAQAAQEKIKAEAKRKAEEAKQAQAKQKTETAKKTQTEKKDEKTTATSASKKSDEAKKTK